MGQNPKSTHNPKDETAPYNSTRTHNGGERRRLLEQPGGQGAKLTTRYHYVAIMLDYRGGLIDRQGATTGFIGPRVGA